MGNYFYRILVLKTNYRKNLYDCNSYLLNNLCIFESCNLNSYKKLNIQYSFTLSEFELFERVKQRDKTAFDTLFGKYYAALCRFSYAMCLSKEDAEESIQDMFVHLWEKAPAININTSLKAYLYTSARNYTLNTIKKQQTEQYHLNEYSGHEEPDEHNDKIPEAEIGRLIQSGVDTLPDKCREIFILCKHEGLTYEEIAEYLDISKKTIDNQMGIALRKLREYLQPKLKKLALILFLYLFF